MISPATALKDKREKKALYEKYNVKEYIIIDPTDQYIERYLLEDSVYGKGDIFGPQEVLKLKALTCIEIPLWKVFEVEAPEELKPITNNE